MLEPMDLGLIRSSWCRYSSGTDAKNVFIPLSLSCRSGNVRILLSPTSLNDSSTWSSSRPSRSNALAPPCFSRTSPRLAPRCPCFVAWYCSFSNSARRRATTRFEAPLLFRETLQICGVQRVHLSLRLFDCRSGFEASNVEPTIVMARAVRLLLSREDKRRPQPDVMFGMGECKVAWHHANDGVRTAIHSQLAAERLAIATVKLLP